MGALTQTRDIVRPTPFVGRERELAEIKAGLDDALAGRGRLFLISGEPGVGKSRLAEEVSSHSTQRNVRVVWGRCWEGGGAPAYWPIIQILRGCAERDDFAQAVETLGDGIIHVAALVPELVRRVAREQGRAAEQHDPNEARFRLFDAVAWLIKGLANREPMVLVIDDLHDAGAAALQMLTFLARALKDVPVLLVGTHREVELERSPEVRSAIAELAREGTHLPLSRLNQSETAELLRARTGRSPDARFLATLYSATEGNPLFVNGVLQVLASEGRIEHQEQVTAAELKLPANLRGAIKARLDRMSSRTAAIISIAAVLGIEFDLEALARVALAPADELLSDIDEAAALGIIFAPSACPTSFRFTHALVRAVIYESIGTAERTRLHGQLGEALEAIYVNDLSARLAEVANHFRLALPICSAQKAVEYSVRASEAAEALYAYEEAVSEGEAALALMKQHGGDPRARAALLERLGHLNRWLGQPEIEHLEAALSVYTELNLPFEAARIRVKLAEGFLARRDTSRALPHLREAERELTKGPPHQCLSGLYVALGNIANDEYRIREALDAYQEAMEVGERAANDDGWCPSAAMAALIQSSCYGRIGEAQGLLNHVWGKLNALSPSHLYWTVMVAGGFHEVLWDPRRAQEWFLRGLTSPLLSKVHRDSLRFHLGGCCHSLGDAVGIRRHLVDWQQLGPSERIDAEILLASAEGDFEGSSRLLQERIESREFGESGHLAQYGYQFKLAGNLRRAGDHARAKVVVASALAPCNSDQMLLYREMAFRPEHALNLAALGDLKAAEAEISRCSEIMDAGEDWRGLTGNFHGAAGYCSAAAGQPEKSAQHFAAAIARFQGLGLPWSEADMLQLWGQALATARQPRSANEKFDEAIKIYRRIGAGQPWIDRALESKSRVAAYNPAAAPNLSADWLFRREGEYWTLVYRGRTSRLKDAKGLRYIAHLLAHPGSSLRALDLVTSLGREVDNVDAVGTHVIVESSTLARGLGDAGELLDGQAKAAYRRRLRVLHEELDDAHELGNRERAEQAQTEIEALAHELKSAVGLAGRDRRAASAAERARVAVTRAIRLAIRKINENDAALGSLLSSTIKTGTLCYYAPDPRLPIPWQL